MTEIPLSEKWVQIGMTFVPIPPELWGRRKEIKEAAKRNFIHAGLKPQKIEDKLMLLFERMKAAA